MSEAADRALDAAQAHRQRHRPHDPAPGERAHHRGDGEAREHPDGQGLRERRPLRQHLVGVHSASRSTRRSRQGRVKDGIDRAVRRVRRRASRGARWSSASSIVTRARMHGRRSAVSGPGLAEARHGKDLAERVSGGARRVRGGRRGARRPALARSASTGPPTSSRSRTTRSPRCSRTARPCGRSCATRSAPHVVAAAGHSLGEFTAYHAAGALDARRCGRAARAPPRRADATSRRGTPGRDGRDPRRPRPSDRGDLRRGDARGGARRAGELQLARTGRDLRRGGGRRARDGAGEGGGREARGAAQRQRRVSLAAHGSRRSPGLRAGARCRGARRSARRRCRERERANR